MPAPIYEEFTASTLPSPGDYRGKVIFRTDINRLQLSDGVRWMDADGGQNDLTYGATVTSAQSPWTIPAAMMGKLVRFDTSGGAIEVKVPAGIFAGLDEAGQQVFSGVRDGANTLTITADGCTINNPGGVSVIANGATFELRNHPTDDNKCDLVVPGAGGASANAVAAITDVRTQYPALGAELAAAPAGLRLYVVESQASLVRSTSGKFMSPEAPIVSPPFMGSSTRRIGPAHVTTISNGAQNRLLMRPVAYRMPGGRPATVAGILVGVNTVGALGVGSDAFDLVVWETDALGKPLEIAPLYTFSYIAGGGTGGIGIGTGAAINYSILTATLSQWSPALALPGGNREFPGYFRMAMVHNLGTAPNLSAVTPGNVLPDSSSYDVTPAAAFSAPFNRHTAYEWTLASFTSGESRSWSASAASTAGSAFAPLLTLA